MDNPVKPPVESVEITPELKALQIKYLGEALTNLITKETPKDVIKTRPGRGGTYPYVPVYWFVPQLNALFGFLWDVVVDDKGIVEEEIEFGEEVKPEALTDAEFGALKIRKVLRKDDILYKIEDCRKVRKDKTQIQVWVAGHLNLKIPGRTIIKDGVETRYDPITITKHAFGGTDIKYYSDRSENAGMMIDLADDYKSAEADMLKKAASYLGMCADVYGVREILQETGPSEGQLKALYRRSESKDLNRTQTLELSGKMFEGLKPEELDSGQYLKFMQHLLSKQTGASVTPTRS